MNNSLLRVTFKLHYLPGYVHDALREDSSLVVGVVGSTPELGSWDPRRMLRADLSEDGVWKAASSLTMASTFTWTWLVTARDGRVLYFDPAGHRQTTLSCFSGILETLWDRKEFRFVANTSAVMMRVHYTCHPGHVMAIVGSGAPLGSWDSQNAILARESYPNSSYWTAEALLDNTVKSYEWKWVVVDEKTGCVVRWEEGENRHLESESDGQLTHVDTQWGSDIRCEHRGTRHEVESYLQEQESSNAHINEAENSEQSSVEVSDTSLIKIATAGSVAEAVWQCAMRRLPAALPFVYDWCRFWG